MQSNLQRMRYLVVRTLNITRMIIILSMCFKEIVLMSFLSLNDYFKKGYTSYVLINHRVDEKTY